jgi:hypothetical protein
MDGIGRLDLRRRQLQHEYRMDSQQSTLYGDCPGERQANFDGNRQRYRDLYTQLHRVRRRSGERVRIGCLELAPCDRNNLRIAGHHHRRTIHYADLEFVECD